MCKEKEIDSMAKTIGLCDIYEKDIECHNPKKHCFCKENPCVHQRIAERLYKVGYRKQSDVANEIFKEIEKIMVRPENTYGIVFYHCSKQSYDKLKKKYTDGNIHDNPELLKGGVENG